MADRYRDSDRDRDERPGDAWRERDGRWRSTERDRPLSDRAADEVRSWFGDDEARRRREWDERREEGGERSAREYGRDYDRDYGRTYRRDYGYGGPVSERGREDRGADLNRDRDFGRSDRYANVDEGTNYGSRSRVENRPPEYWRGRESYRGTSGYGTERGAGGWGRLDEPRALSSSRDWDVGPYAGRGPRGYRRSDERIHEELCERLTRHGRIDASDLDIRVQNGEVTLSGTVEDRDAKRLAEDVAESVFGVRDVNNQIKVHRSELQAVGTSGRRELGETPRPGENAGSVLGLAGTATTPEITPPDRGERARDKA